MGIYFLVSENAKCLIISVCYFRIMRVSIIVINSLFPMCLDIFMLEKVGI